MDPGSAIGIGIAFLLAGFVKGIVGLGFPLVALVLLTLSAGLLDALALIVIPTFVTNVWQALDGKHLRSVVRRLRLYLLVSMAGVLLTSQFLAAIDVDWLTALLGTTLIFFSATRLLGLHLSVSDSTEPAVSALLGAVNGLLTGLTGVFLVPSVLYMDALGFSRDELVQGMGVFFAVSTVMLAISLGRNELLSGSDAIVSTAALIPSLCGVYGGRWMRRRMSEEQFNRVFLITLSLLGAYLLVRSAAALFRFS